MRPTLGRIVIYNTTEEDRIVFGKFGNRQEKLPAIIVAIWSDDCVNLKVLGDGTQDLWITSVHLGTEEFSWNWPVINNN